MEFRMNEEWRDIKGYEGLYQISSTGRLKTLKRLIAYGYQNVSRFIIAL